MLQEVVQEVLHCTVEHPRFTLNRGDQGGGRLERAARQGFLDPFRSASRVP